MNSSTDIAIELLKYIGSGFGGVGVILVILFLFPEKVEKWSVLLWRAVYFLVRKGEKKIVAHDIQARVNEFTKSLRREIVNFEPVGVSIQWVTEKETPKEFFDANRLIIRMRHHDDQNKNFVHASMVFISRVLLTKAKRYLSPTQKESVDLFVARKLFQKEKPQVLDRFFEDYFSAKAHSSEKIMELMEKYEIVDKVGLFFPILIQELMFLGEKVFYKPRSENIITEIKEFISFLQHYAEREVGEETIPTDFEGAYCRCGIVIIAKSLKRDIGDTGPFVRYVQRLVEKRLENIYLLGSASRENRDFVDQISDEIRERFGLERYTSRKFKARIIIGGKRKEVDSYLVLHRHPGALRYYDREYQEQFIEQ